MIAAPDGASPEVQQVVKAVNAKLIDVVENIVSRGAEDRRTVRAVTVLLAFVMVGGIAGVIISTVRGNTATAVTAGLITAAPLLVALVLNPFQYLERSDFLTTWVDVIAATFALRLAAGDSLTDYKAAAADATTQLKALGEVYAAMSAKTLEVVRGVDAGNSEPGQPGENEKDAAKGSASPENGTRGTG